MKRIFAEKKEPLAELIEKIIGDPDEEILLVIPKNAVVGSSTSDFHLIKREAQSSGKNLRVESVDEGVLALARSSGIEALHPLLDDMRHSSLSDIVVPRGGMHSEIHESKTGKKSVAKSMARNQYVPHEVKASIAEESRRGDEGIEDHPKKTRRFGFNRKLVFGCVVALVVIGGGFFMVDRFFSRATVTINFRKVAWSYDHPFVADVSVSKAIADKNVLPAELFTLQRNITQLFPASGRSNVSLKAAGKIIIYNNYSSKPQLLVATTRFEAPDGKIFRIIDQVLVPGAEVKDGKIIPSRSSGSIVADKPGPDYNIGPVAKLTIPGFKGSPRYSAFYGEITEQLKGGFVGEKAVPTKDDISQAKAKTTEILKTSLQNNFLAAYPADFKILEGASEITVAKLSVNENTDQNGKFGVFGEASMKAVGFREPDLKSLLLALAQSDNPKMVFKNLKLEYKAAAADFKNKKASFNLSASGELWPDFKEREFELGILGKKIGDVRSLVSSLEGLSTAKISVWPIWLGTIPQDPNKVSISVD